MINVKSKVFLKFLMAYLLIIVLLTAAIGVMFYYNASKIKKEIVKVNSLKLESIKNIIDLEILVPSQNLITNILLNTDEQYSYFVLNPYIDKLPLIRSFRDKLRIKKFSYDFIESINIYYKSNKFVISSEGFKVDTESYYDATFINEILPKSTDIDNSWYPARNVDNINNLNAVTESVISYGRTKPISRKLEDSDMYIYINLYESSILDKVGQIYNNETEEFFLFRGDGQIITGHTPNKSYEEVLKKIIDEDRNNETFEIDGKQVVITYYRSVQNDLYYFLASPNEVYYTILNNIKKTIIIFSLGVLLIGSLIAFFISKRLSLPIMNIVSKIMQKENMQFKNEYKFINDSIDRMKISIIQLEDNLYESSYRDMIYGKERVKKNGDKSFENPNFKIIAVEFLENATISKDELIKDKFLSAFNSIFTDCCNVYTVILQKDIIAIILNYTELNNELYDQLENELIMQTSNNKYRLRIGIGSEEQGADAVYLSYNNANEALAYSFVYGYNHLIYYDEISQIENKHVLIDNTELESMIKSCDYPKVKNYFDKFADLLKNGEYSLKNIEFAFLQLISNINNIIIGFSSSTRHMSFKDLYNGFYKQKTIDEAISWINGIVNGIMKILSEKDRYKNKEILDKIKDFIEVNINVDISLEMLSKISFLSPSYISRLFKEYYNIGFTDYLLSLRLEQASEILLTKNEKIDDIAKKIGFNSSAYFIKKFKQKYGVTPNKYKVMNKNKL